MGQFALACFLVVGEYQDFDTVQRGTDPKVTMALEDAHELIDEARHAAGPWETATIALSLLAVAREHGTSPKRRAPKPEQSRRNVRKTTAATSMRVSTR